MLLGTLGASLLGNLLTGEGIVRAGSGRPSSSPLQNKKGKGIGRASSGCRFLNSCTSYHASSSALQNKKEWDF